jgi:N-acylglucosamine 2-epimerase
MAKPTNFFLMRLSISMLTDPNKRKALSPFYRDTLAQDVVPFWLTHAMDPTHGGIFTSLDRDGTLLDTDKSIWFQGRAAWMFATIALLSETETPCRAAAESCIKFLRQHANGPKGKMWFLVTQDGQPLRMRRYVYSESFAAIAFAAWHSLSHDPRAAIESTEAFATYLHHSFSPGIMPAKWEPTRPMKSLGPLMIGIATAQELRLHLHDPVVNNKNCSEWIQSFIDEIQRDFFKPDQNVLLETVAPDGAIIDHFEGRTLNPGHAIECAWFILREANYHRDVRLKDLGCAILDAMWQRGWDPRHGGLFYFRDLQDRPVTEYWHDMKFWWPQCEAIIATQLAFALTGQDRYAEWHQLVHEWSFTHFSDKEHGEWFGYLHRDGTPSSTLKGNHWKGPFHLPRMLHICGGLDPAHTPGEWLKDPW